jgi:hypothetical protein
MTLTGKVFAAGALVALIGFPISSVLAQSPNATGDKSASASAPSSMNDSSASASASAPSSMNDSSASASAPAAAASASTSMGGDSSASASAPAQSAQIDDATLQKAAKAYVKVKQIVHQTKEASPSSASAQPDQASAQSEKLAAVKNEGLDPKQYDQVIQTVQNDPQLQQKFANYVIQNGGNTD